MQPRCVPLLQDQCWRVVVQYLEFQVTQANLKRPPTPTRASSPRPADPSPGPLSAASGPLIHAPTPVRATTSASFTETAGYIPMPTPSPSLGSAFGYSAVIHSATASTSGGVLSPQILAWLERCPCWLREGLLRRSLSSRLSLSLLLHFLALPVGVFVPELDFTRSQRFNPSILIAFLQKHSAGLSSSSSSLGSPSVQRRSTTPANGADSLTLHRHPLVERIVVNLSSLEHLSFQANIQVTDVALYEMLKYCPHLKKLNVSYCKKITTAFVTDVIPKYSSLTDLDLGWLAITDASLSALYTLTNLQQLHIGYCKGVTSNGIGRLLQGIKTLASLDVRGCPGIHLPLFAPAPVELQILQLNFSHCSNATDSTFQQLHCPALRVLSVASCARLGDGAISTFVSRTPCLQSLDLQFCGFSAPQIASEALQTVLLNDCKSLSARSIEFIAARCPNLHEIQLRDTQTTDRCLELFAVSCTKLEVINISRCAAISDFGVAALASRCIYLLNVDISWNTKLTDLCLDQLTTKCLQLQELKLFGCVGITTLALNAVKAKRRLGLKISCVVETLDWAMYTSIS